LALLLVALFVPFANEPIDALPPNAVVESDGRFECDEFGVKFMKFRCKKTRSKRMARDRTVVFPTAFFFQINDLQQCLDIFYFY
jgi:hypothetical protein